MASILGEFLKEWEKEKEINYIIHRYSDVLLGKVDSFSKFNDEKNIKFDEDSEIIEARLFNEKKELFVYKYNDDWKRIQTVHENMKHENAEIINRVYELENKFKYKSIKVRKYINYDDDMAYVEKTCPLRFIGGRKDE